MNITLATIASAAPPAGDDGFSVGLLIVVVLASLVLAGTAITVLVRPRDDDFSLPERASLRGIVGAGTRPVSPDGQLDHSSRDELTGLANRRRLDHDAAAHADRRGITAVMMVDIDQYGEVREQFGRRAADRLVRRIGDILSAHVRIDDVVYRYGEQEFCILLPEATIAEGHIVAARLIDAVHAHELRDGGRATISIGVAGTTDGRINRALTGADLALLDAKRAGRDQAASSFY